MNQHGTLYPAAYLLTFGTFGTWLPGDARGWHRRGTPRHLSPSHSLRARCVARLTREPVHFNPADITTAHDSIVETCAHYEWPLHALAVQDTHVHAVISAARSPEAVVQRVKAWATRALRSRGEYLSRPVWSEHGSTHYLHTRAAVEAAIAYVNDPHHEASGFTVPTDR